VCGGWKKIPVQIKDELREALKAGGVDIRMVPGPFLYLDKNYVRILGSLEKALKRTDELPGRTVVIQLRGETAPIADEVIIVTGDKDIFQLVDKKTKVFLLKQGISGGELVTEKEVEEKLGIKPEQVVDYKALAGDPSDNYKGVKGIGPKTAKKLLKEFGSLEKIIPTLDKKKQKQALLSRELAQIRCDLKLDLDWQDSELDYNPAAVKEIFEKFHFKSLIKELEKNKQEQMRLL